MSKYIVVRMTENSDLYSYEYTDHDAAQEYVDSLSDKAVLIVVEGDAEVSVEDYT